MVKNATPPVPFNDNDSALQHNSKYNNNNDHNSEVNVYCIEGLPATCAGSQEVN